MRPDEALWGLGEHLLARNLDALRVLIWQQTEDGQRGRNYPDPTPRPGVESPSERKHVVKAVPMDQMNARLGWAKT